MPTHSGPSAPIVNQPNSHWSGSQVAVKWYSNGSQWNSKNNQTKFSTGLFWTCILEQPRVEFDTPLFQYTGPEQPRVNWMTLERRQVDFNWMLSACGVDVELMLSGCQWCRNGRRGLSIHSLQWCYCFNARQFFLGYPFFLHANNSWHWQVFQQMIWNKEE